MAAALRTPALGGALRSPCSSAWREPPNSGAVASNAVPCAVARDDRPLLHYGFGSREKAWRRFPVLHVAPLARATGMSAPVAEQVLAALRRQLLQPVRFHLCAVE